MWPRIGPFHTYGILYLTGILLHFLLSRRTARRFSLERRVWIAASVCYMLGMTVGAKILFDIRTSGLDLPALLDSRHWTQGGLWGGLLAYLVLSTPMVLILTRNWRAGLDLIALSVPIPWIMAKLGCLLNGCCYGTPCSLPWAIVFPQGARGAPAGVPIHPTQLYEVGLMVILIVLFRLLDLDRWRGTFLLWFLAIYGIGRAATDTLRGDNERYTYVGPVTVTQLICLAVAAIAIVALVTMGTDRAKSAHTESIPS
jgi:phosphatidylglycerol:prolipoprotein diacylglycerol transferase